MWGKHLMILMDPSLLFQHFQRPKNHVSTIGHQMSGFPVSGKHHIRWFNGWDGGIMRSRFYFLHFLTVVLSSPKIHFLEDNPVPLILNALPPQIIKLMGFVPNVSWVHPILMASQGWWLNVGTLCQRWMARNQWGSGRIIVPWGWYFSPSFHNYQWSLGSPSNFMNPLV